MQDALFARVSGLARRVLPLLGACLLAPALAAAQQPAVRELDIADYRAYLTDDHPVRQGMRRFAQLVESGSEGRMRVRVRTDALPGTPAQQLAALHSGARGAPALMLVAGTGLAAAAPDFVLLDLPFLVRDEAHADALLDGPFGDALLARLENGKGGLVGLAWWENGFRQITTSGAPVKGAADLRGLKLRVIGEPVFVEGARAMGADPIPLPFGALYEALKTRRVDAQDNFISQILAGRLHEVQSSLSLTGHSYSPLVLVANPAAWTGLSPAQQRVIRAAASEAGRFQRSAAREEARQAQAQLARHGLAIHAPAPAELDLLRASTAPLRTRYFSRHGDDLWRLYQEQDGAR
ncbi:DctP family TRAP transporter solute-binding subunit [Massilia sp. LjRoot122]|uniref:DctP family TRAP transporter solute-binding subunit n=1 Tax=Massilia sp. LjRoot122 TaxID=3342257 RepID=UPI003ED11FFE